MFHGANCRKLSQSQHIGCWGSCSILRTAQEFEPRSKFSMAMWCLSCCMEVNAGRWPGKFPGNLMSSKLNVFDASSVSFGQTSSAKKTCWHPVIWNHSLLLCEREGGDGWAMSYGWKRTWSGRPKEGVEEVGPRWPGEGQWWNSWRSVVSALTQLGDGQKIGSSGGLLWKPHVPLWALWVLSEWVKLNHIHFFQSKVLKKNAKCPCIIHSSNMKYTS